MVEPPHPDILFANAALALGDSAKPPPGVFVWVGRCLYGVMYFDHAMSFNGSRIIGQKIAGLGSFRVVIGPRTRYRVAAIPDDCLPFDQWERWEV